MGWKPGKWKLNLKEGRDRWLVVLAVGLIFLILAFPTAERGSQGILGGKELSEAGGEDTVWGNPTASGQNGGQTEIRSQAPAGGAFGRQTGDKTGTGGAAGGREAQEEAVQAGAQAAAYEQQLELRLKELLSHVEGVGEVEVMIVLKSSEEKVWRTDRNSSLSSTKETDSNGGTRDVRNQEISEDTILTGSGGGEGPLLEKELKPEIGGVVVSATGGGSPVIQAEISAAVEALFDVPSHKIKVLKRAE